MQSRGIHCRWKKQLQVIDYDEVRSNHTYSDIQTPKMCTMQFRKCCFPLQRQSLMKSGSRRRMAISDICRESIETPRFIWQFVEAVYYPPDPEDIPELMKSWIRETNIESVTVKEIFEKIAANHIRFERIHPFADGNGRTGRMIINQQLINNGLLPVSIRPTGKYREAFRRYDKREDLSEMVYVLLRSELESFDRVAAWL